MTHYLVLKRAIGKKKSKNNNYKKPKKNQPPQNPRTKQKLRTNKKTQNHSKKLVEEQQLNQTLATFEPHKLLVLCCFLLKHTGLSLQLLAYQIYSQNSAKSGLIWANYKPSLLFLKTY